MCIRDRDALYELRPGAEWSIDGRDYGRLKWLDKSQTKPTLDELNTKLSAMNLAEPMRLLRLERDMLIAESDWMANSDVTMSSAWKTYRQALRDLPANSTPKIDSNRKLDMSSVTWPTKPS